MIGRMRNRGMLAAAFVAGIAGCGDAEAPTALPAEARIDPEAVVIRAEEADGRVRISIASETARPTAVLLTLRWDADKAVLHGEFSLPADSETIVAADAATPGRLRIAAVGLITDQNDSFKQLLGEFRLERQGATGTFEVIMEVEQVLENDERITPARVVAFPLSISLNR